jgi:hypothetical protein
MLVGAPIPILVGHPAPSLAVHRIITMAGSIAITDPHQIMKIDVVPSIQKMKRTMTFQ